MPTSVYVAPVQFSYKWADKIAYEKAFFDA